MAFSPTQIWPNATDRSGIQRGGGRAVVGRREVDSVSGRSLMGTGDTGNEMLPIVQGQGSEGPWQRPEEGKVNSRSIQ